MDYKNLPHAPGVYLFLDKEKRPIYIGKAKDLKKRVSQYFRKNVDAKTSVIIKKAEEIKYILTSNEVEALILECSLIKSKKPKYNINLKDDKTYPYVKITNEAYPRVFVTRRIVDDGSEYYGPYTKARELKNSIRFIRGFLGLRSCSKMKQKPCLNYHMKRCLGPCTGSISQEEYEKRVNLARKFLKGKYSSLINELKSKLEDASSKLKFELASSIRDKIYALESIIESQKVVLKRGDFDALSVSRLERRVGVMVFFVREGRVIGSEFYALSRANNLSDEEVINEFIKLYYYKRNDAPRELVVNALPPDSKLISEALGLKIKVPKRGKLKELLELVMRNGVCAIKEELLKERSMSNAARELKETLGLKKIPKVIEGVDISNISGTLATGSIVCFKNGFPCKGNYKRFRIKGVFKPNDYEMLKEVIYRRYKNKNALPDLLVIDGGKGQLNACLSVLGELKLNIPCVAIAKSFEHLFIKGKDEPIVLPGNSDALRLVQRVRDEAHRFAISYHKFLRHKIFKK